MNMHIMLGFLRWINNNSHTHNSKLIAIIKGKFIDTKQKLLSSQHNDKEENVCWIFLKGSIRIFSEVQQKIFCFELKLDQTN